MAWLIANQQWLLSVAGACVFFQGGYIVATIVHHK
jgi:hypothetical protein